MEPTPLTQNRSDTGADILMCVTSRTTTRVRRSAVVTTIVGLAQMAVKESIERVRRSIINCGYSFPAHALLINLAPADVKKEGPALDLPMAIGVLRGTNFIKTDRHKSFHKLRTVTTDARGYWRFTTGYRSGRRFRVYWTAPDGTVYKGPPIRAYR